MNDNTTDGIYNAFKFVLFGFVASRNLRGHIISLHLVMCYPLMLLYIMPYFSQQFSVLELINLLQT